MSKFVLNNGIALAALAVTSVPVRAFQEQQLPLFAASAPFDEITISPWKNFASAPAFNFSAPGAFAAPGKSFTAVTAIKGTSLLLGVQSSAGYASGLSMQGFGSAGFASAGLATGYDFGSQSVKLGVNMGRLVPYMTATTSFVRPANNFGLAPIGNSFTSTPSKSFSSAGVGFDYAITDKMSFGVAVQVGTFRNQ